MPRIAAGINPNDTRQTMMGIMMMTIIMVGRWTGTAFGEICTAIESPTPPASLVRSYSRVFVRSRTCRALWHVRTAAVYLPLHNICRHSRVSRETHPGSGTGVVPLSVVIRRRRMASWKWLAHVAKWCTRVNERVMYPIAKTSAARHESLERVSQRSGPLATRWSAHEPGPEERTSARYVTPVWGWSPWAT